jgi:hypothetical protein
MLHVMHMSAAWLTLTAHQQARHMLNSAGHWVCQLACHTSRLWAVLYVAFTVQVRVCGTACVERDIRNAAGCGLLPGAAFTA